MHARTGRMPSDRPLRPVCVHAQQPGWQLPVRTRRVFGPVRMASEQLDRRRRPSQLRMSQWPGEEGMTDTHGEEASQQQQRRQRRWPQKPRPQTWRRAGDGSADRHPHGARREGDAATGGVARPASSLLDEWRRLLEDHAGSGAGAGAGVRTGAATGAAAAAAARIGRLRRSSGPRLVTRAQAGTGTGTGTGTGIGTGTASSGDCVASGAQLVDQQHSDTMRARAGVLVAVPAAACRSL